MITRLASLCLLCLALVACGGDDTPPGPGNPDAPPGGTPDAPPAACGNIAGSWDIGGTCGDDTCSFTQTGCAITQVSCTSGAHSTSGDLTGNTFSYTGVSGGGVPADCDGTLTGNTMAGTCDIAGLGTCSFDGTRN